MKKKYIVTGALVAILALTYALTPSFDTIVKKVVHKYGSQATKTDVILSGFDLSLKNGTGQISNFTIANPTNYKSPYLLSLKSATIKVDIKSLLKDTIIIDEINIQSPEITYELMSLTQNNFKEILSNLSGPDVSKEEVAGKKAKTDDKYKAKKASKKIIIKKVIVNGGLISAVENLTKGENTLSIPLPSIEINGIGEKNNGQDIKEVMTTVLKSILDTATKTVAKSKLQNLKAVAQENLDSVVDGVKDRINLKGIFGK